MLGIGESSYVCSSDERGPSDRSANVGEKEVRPGSGMRLETFSVLHGRWKMEQDRDSAKQWWLASSSIVEKQWEGPKAFCWFDIPEPVTAYCIVTDFESAILRDALTSDRNMWKCWILSGRRPSGSVADRLTWARVVAPSADLYPMASP